MGFGQSTSDASDLSVGDLLAQVNSDDLIEFGLIPELIGRLPVISSLRPLEADSLVRVLKEPKNALTKQYQHLFAMEEADLKFTDKALQAIAQRAAERETGARGLRSIIEGVMLDIMFELPDQPRGSRYVVTDDIVEGRAKLFNDEPPATKSA
jgi:ATP-dependent Clp protease ATP-binding subunit ClpX